MGPEYPGVKRFNEEAWTFQRKIIRKIVVYY
jgi:hypothetical protein